MYEVPVVVVDVSIILPIHNAEKWIEPCLDSVLAQTFSGSMELCICNDACTDGSMLKVNDYIKTLSKQNINVVITESSDGENAKPKGMVSNLFSHQLIFKAFEYCFILLGNASYISS